MTKTPKDGQRLPWAPPQLRRIEAGSAEAVDKVGGGDGSKTSSDKS